MSLNEPVTGLRLIQTGVQPLDEALGGLPAGSLVGIFGRAGTGKTSLCIQMAHHMASRGVRVLFFSIPGSNRSLHAQAASLGFDLRPLEESGVLKIVSFPDPATAEEARRTMIDLFAEADSFPHEVSIVDDPSILAAKVGTSFLIETVSVELTKRFRETGRLFVVSVDPTLLSLSRGALNYTVSRLDVVVELRAKVKDLGVERILRVLKARGLSVRRHAVRFGIEPGRGLFSI
ncbi:MAG TPA: hypothetical protein ENG69_02230 [Candidatus Korarchaeota archaeon]|nr:hypothetical protein [Candidatus Korarchaeota archaeon]